MKRPTFHRSALAGAVLLALLPAAALAAPGDDGARAYLASVRARAGADALTVDMRLRGNAIQSLSYQPGAIQVTLEDAFLDPAKQHIPVDHPAVREVFAYQYDPTTVRVRIVTEGIDARTLERGVDLTAEKGVLHLSVSGLPAPATTAKRPVAKAPAKTEARPAPAKAAPPVVKAVAVAAPKATEAVAPAPESTPKAAPDAARRPVTEAVARRAAEARSEALATLEGILSPEPVVEREPAPAPTLVRVTPDAGTLGGGKPAAEAPPAEVVPEAVAEAPLEEAPAPVAQVPPGVEAPADTVAAAPAPEPSPAAGRWPLRTLPADAAGPPSLWASGARMAGGLLVVLALLVGGLAVLRRFKGVALGGRVPIRVLASASVGSRQNIVVVDVEGRRLVVGVGPGGTELLADLDTAPAADDALTPEGGTTPRPSGKAESPFARALRRVGERGTRDAIARTKRDLERQIRLLKERRA